VGRVGAGGGVVVGGGIAGLIGGLAVAKIELVLAERLLTGTALAGKRDY
jgi:hypothetical protein